MLEVKIIVKGRIDTKWADWLGGLMMSCTESDQTILTGVLPDQAAVYGIIARIRDLGLDLSSVSIEVIEKDNGKSQKVKGEKCDGQ